MTWLALVCTHLQLRLRQARSLRNITLFKSPVQTIYYCAVYATNGLYSGAKWVASHPVTMVVVMPALLAYAFTKWGGYKQEMMNEIEVRFRWWMESVRELPTVFPRLPAQGAPPALTGAHGST